MHQNCLRICYALLNFLCLYILFMSFHQTTASESLYLQHVFVAYIWCVAVLRLLVLTLYVTLFHLLWNHIFQNTHISGTILLTQDKPIATLTTLTIHYWSCSNDALPLNKFCNKCTSVKTNSIAKVVFLFASFIFIFLP